MGDGLEHSSNTPVTTTSFAFCNTREPRKRGRSDSPMLVHGVAYLQIGGTTTAVVKPPTAHARSLLAVFTRAPVEMSRKVIGELWYAAARRPLG